MTNQLSTDTKPKFDRVASMAKARAARMNLIKQGRPFGSSNLWARQSTNLAKAFKARGLDWRVDFADAILANNKERIDLWMRLMPFMTTQNDGFRRNGGYEHKRSIKPRKDALNRLAELERGE